MSMYCIFQNLKYSPGSKGQARFGHKEQIWALLSLGMAGEKSHSGTEEKGGAD